MHRQLTGFKPSGALQLGNYLGAVRPAVAAQHELDSVVMVVDLHALTVEHDPRRVRRHSHEVAALLLGAGVDPARSLFYLQSHVPEHTELHYLLECATRHGEAARMIQFREKGGAGSRLSLLTYPVLMAADILLHGADRIPVGADQRQHVELARDVALRFNRRYGEVFTVPTAVAPPHAARVRDLTDPTAKMGKSNASGAGVLFLLDPPDTLRRKISRAVTDAGREVRYAPADSPGVANLLEILAGCVDDDPARLAGLFDSYGELKAAVADVVVSTLAPVRERATDLLADPAQLDTVLADGAERARDRAAATLREVRAAMGLLPRAAA